MFNITYILIHILLTLSTPVRADTDLDGDGYPSSLDCDDADPLSNPGVDLETCDGHDNNCDGVVNLYERDEDGDGYAFCDGDCDDSDSARSPVTMELPNEIDDNCDGRIDEGTIWGDDDGDGYSEAAPGHPDDELVLLDCDDSNPDIHPGVFDSDTEADAVDNDCDGRLDEGFRDYDLDGDGYSPIDWDCDDQNPTVHPGAPELPNGIDDDCDGEDLQVYGCQSNPAMPGPWGLVMGLLALRRRQMFALSALLLPFGARAQSAAQDLSPEAETLSRCAPLRGPGGLTAPSGELGEQANARFYGGWSEAVRESDLLLTSAASTLDLAWSYKRAQAHLQLMEEERRQQQLGLPPAREHQEPVQAPAEPDPAYSERDEEMLLHVRALEERRWVALAEQLATYRGFWGEGAGAQMWAEVELAASRGDLVLVEETMWAWTDTWPMSDGPPENILNLIDQIRSDQEYRESLECACGQKQAQPFLAEPTMDGSLPSNELSAAAREDIQALQLQAQDEAGAALAAQREALGDSPLPIAGALEVRARFDALIVDFLSAPSSISPSRWAELWWRHGLAALLAGDEQAAWRSLWQAAAVSGAPLPVENLPPTFASLVRQAEQEQARGLRGTLELSVSPEALVLVDGRAVGTTFGEVELALPPGLHLVVINEPGISRPYVAIHEVRSGKQTQVRWGAGSTGRAEGPLGLMPIKSPANTGVVSDSTSTVWRVALGPRGAMAMDTSGLGGSLALSLTVQHRLIWVDGAGLALLKPVQRTVDDQDHAFASLSAGAAWTSAAEPWSWSIGGGAYAHPGYGFGPLLRASAGWEPAAWGLMLDFRGAWDLAEHVSDVPRLSTSVGLAVTWRMPDSVTLRR